MTCQTCTGRCRQGRDCPIAQQDAEDPLAPSRGIAVALVLAICFWACVAAAVTLRGGA
jgi:hypothetical protein